MSDPSSSNDPRALWQAQAAADTAPTLKEIHMQAEAFQKRIRRRNMIEYIAAAVVIAGFTPGLFGPSWLMKAGCLEIILAMVFITWQLHRRGSARKAPTDVPGAALLEFHRSELLRQRDAVRTAWLWNVTPLVPGLVLLMLGRWFQFHVQGRSLELDHWIIALCSVIVLLMLGVVMLVQRLGKYRLEKRIAELDAMRSA